MFGFGKKTELDLILDNLQMNLENNYKDEAHKAFKEAKSLFDRLVAENAIKGRAKDNAEARLKQYAKKLEGYGHYNSIGW